MAKRVVEEAVGSWNKRKDAANGEKNDRMCQKCLDARRGNIENTLTFYKELPKDVRCHQLCSRFLLTT